MVVTVFWNETHVVCLFANCKVAHSVSLAWLLGALGV